MRYGICTHIGNVAKVATAGYDYIELRGDWLATRSEPELDQVRQTLSNSPIRCEASNFFFPAALKVVGPAVDETEIDAYIERAVARAVALGVKIIVVGSGKSRFVPEGWSQEKARSQFAAVLQKVGCRAAQAGITVVIEAIRSASTNLINNLTEAAALCEEVAEPNVAIMADYNQMVGDRESMSSIIETGRFIKHLHVIDTVNSYFPLNLKDQGLEAFFTSVKTIGYQGRISVEIHDFESVADAAQSLQLLKSWLQ